MPRRSPTEETSGTPQKKRKAMVGSVTTGWFCERWGKRGGVGVGAEKRGGIATEGVGDVNK